VKSDDILVLLLIVVCVLAVAAMAFSHDGSRGPRIRRLRKRRMRRSCRRRRFAARSLSNAGTNADGEDLPPAMPQYRLSRCVGPPIHAVFRRATATAVLRATKTR
jgi:hypothetical protein